MLKFIRLRKSKSSKKKRKASSGNVLWEKAPDIEKNVRHILAKIGSDIKVKNIYFYRSYNSKSRAYARIWGLSRLWQMALSTEPSYIIEVLSQHFDKLSRREKDRVLVHELTHIPKNFSGSLLPHTKKRGKRNFHDKVERMFDMYNKRGKI